MGNALAARTGRNKWKEEMMNIKEAKEEIKHSVMAYLKKGEEGDYLIESVRQRPLLLIGPPGIGKTQIMEQVARECKIGLVAYTITHHTRQSAVGLPFIKEEEYQGKNYSVTQYTMSEIIASVYRKIEETGLLEGILFIDEINCVSETLAPTMLQFLQCKTFGNQAIPKGWLIVAAGNPPEYNKSVREFDMVTLDRVRCMEVSADLTIWKEYAMERQIHSAILSYLELRPKNFYRIEADVDGMQFVTARGWEDLSSLIKVYELLEIDVTKEVILEFLHHEDVAEDVSAYFDLYQKYREDYGIQEILRGVAKPNIYERIYAAAFDERLSVVNLLLDGLGSYFKRAALEKYRTDEWYDFLKEYRRNLGENKDKVAACYQQVKEQWQKFYLLQKQQGLITKEEVNQKEKLLGLYESFAPKEAMDEAEAFAYARVGFEQEKEVLLGVETEVKEALEHAFDFMEGAFHKGQEMVVFITGLTLNSASAIFLANHGCKRYLEYNQELLIGKKRGELLSELKVGLGENKA